MVGAKKHKDVNVWDIEENFQLDLVAIHNIEITSEQVKDNIDKVGTIVILNFSDRYEPREKTGP